MDKEKDVSRVTAKSMWMDWEVVCAIINPKGRCMDALRKKVFGEKKDGKER